MIKNKSRLSFIILPIVFLLAFACAFSLRAPVDARAEEVTSLLGQGTKDSPKTITSVDEFLFFINAINDTNEDEAYLEYYYSLNADLDLSSSTVAPIGTATRQFNGKFDGKGYVISGFTLSTSGDNVGLFGYVGEQATITSIGVVGGRITAYNSANVGGIAGYNLGRIDNCFYQGVITARQNVGGVVGVNCGTIAQCFSNGYLYASASEANLGGIVGQNHNVLQYSYSIASISASNQNATNIGGVIGGRYTSQVNATPTGTFFNGSINSGKDAVGYGSNSIDKSSVALDSTRTQALSRVDFNTFTLQKLFGNSVNWTRDAFVVTNHSAYVAPLQNVFADRLKESGVTDSLKRQLENATFERMYGISDEVYAEWGSIDNPYLISNETQLRNLQQGVSGHGESYFEKYFSQTTDITLTSSFSPIGNRESNNVFQGTYDGCNYSISGLTITETANNMEYLGMFGYIGESSTIRNITLDDSCEISGVQYVGSLVGYNYGGTISNIESRATVKAQGRSGGIVGVTRGGNYYDILSAVKLELRGNVNGGLYGIIGGYQTENYTYESNVWYFVDSPSNEFISSNNVGKVMIADGNNGKVVASKTTAVNQNGDPAINIIFKAESGSVADSFSLEFRRDEEQTIKENVLETVYFDGRDDEESREFAKTKVVYARFVKPVAVSFASNESFATATLKDEYNKEISKIYSGQNFVLSVNVLDSAYLAGITAIDSLGNGIELTYKNSSGAITEPVFSYNGNSSSVEYLATMQNLLYQLQITINIIHGNDGDFANYQVYDGDPVYFPVENLIIPENFLITVNYSGGSAPIKANQSNAENYAFTVIYQNENGVRMGSKNGFIHISKRQLYIPVDDLPNTKEWDGGIDEAVVANIDGQQEQVYYMITTDDGVEKIYLKDKNDVVVVGATMDFKSDDIMYDASLNYTNTIVEYTFTLSGKDASNYIAPANASKEGTVTRRKLKIKFDSYEGVFAGLDSRPSLSGKNIIASGVIASRPYEAVYKFLGANGEDIDANSNFGAVGEYRLVVNLTGDSERYYDISFVDANVSEDSSYTYVTYTVNPCVVDVVYLIDGNQVDNIVYDGSAHTVSAYFTDVSLKKTPLTTLAITNKDGDIVSALQNAGEYVINSTCDDSNYDISFSSQKVIEVKKAEQEELIFTSSSTHDFGTTYKAVVIGGSGVGEVTFSVDEECADMASFEGDLLTITKAGEITIIATLKDESGNYNDISNTLVLTVNKLDIQVCVASFEVDYLDVPVFNFVSTNGIALGGVVGVNVLLDGVEYEEGQILDVKDYQMSITLNEDASSDGYLLSIGQCGTLSVRPLAITVTAEDKSSQYGQEIVDLTYAISDSRVDSLNGSLSTIAKEVGESAITAGTITSENNANFDITFVEGTYTITAKEIIVNVLPQEKKYGDEDPAPKYEVLGLAYDDTPESIGLEVNIQRVLGENAYEEGVGLNRVYQYLLLGDITMTSTNYIASFQTASLTILPGIPQVETKEEVEIAPGIALDDSNVPSMVVVGKVYENSSWETKEIAGEITWKENLTPNFKNSATITHKAIFTPQDKNFSAIEVDIDVRVIPVEVTVKFTSSKQIVYNGYDHDEVEYELVGVIDGQDAKEEVTYEGDVRNVGTFVVKVTLNNCIYKLAGSGEATIRISKADLEIMVEDIVTVEGETPKIEYLYFGLQKGDTYESLTSAPTVILPVEPGTYTITPSGARASNYNIKYKSFTYKVLTKVIQDIEKGLKLDGEFDNDTEFTMKEISASGEISDKYSDLQSGYKALEKMGIDQAYELKYVIGEEVVTIDGKVYLTMTLPSKYADTKVAYAVLTNNGELLYVQDVLYDGDIVKINVSNAKALMILTEQEDNSLLLYVAIGAGVVLLLVIFIIVRAIKKHREARYIKYDD